MNGFYAAYITGRAGSSIVLFCIRDATIVGVDIGGMKYDGKIEVVEDGFKCSVVYEIPVGATLITGGNPPNSPQRIPLQFFLPKQFNDGPIVHIETPLGPINARFEKIRDL